MSITNLLLEKNFFLIINNYYFGYFFLKFQIFFNEIKERKIY